MATDITDVTDDLLVISVSCRLGGGFAEPNVLIRVTHLIKIILREKNLEILGIVVDADQDLAARWQALKTRLRASEPQPIYINSSTESVDTYVVSLARKTWYANGASHYSKNITS